MSRKINSLLMFGIILLSILAGTGFVFFKSQGNFKNPSPINKIIDNLSVCSDDVPYKNIDEAQKDPQSVCSISLAGSELKVFPPQIINLINF